MKLLNILIFSLIVSGCFYNSEPRPDYKLTEDFKITSSGLPAYSTPPCILPENTMECSYLNYEFDITEVRKYGRDSIVAWDAKKPANRIKIYCQRIYDQDGTYVILDGGYRPGVFMVIVEIKGNSLGSSNSQSSVCTSGQLYIKKTLTGWDVVICDATFKYSVLSGNYNGIMKAHFVIKE